MPASPSPPSPRHVAARPSVVEPAPAGVAVHARALVGRGSPDGLRRRLAGHGTAWVGRRRGAWGRGDGLPLPPPPPQAARTPNVAAAAAPALHHLLDIGASPDVYSSRCTVSGAKAGMHTARYSAPSASGVLYCTHSPAWVMTPARVDVQHAVARPHPQHPLQDDGVLVELGVWPGSTHPPGLRMRATLTPAVWELTRPTYSSISLGLLPAAWMTVGCGISVGMLVALGAHGHSTNVAAGDIVPPRPRPSRGGCSAGGHRP